MWRDRIPISRKCGKPFSKTCQGERRQCGARSGVINTQIFSRPPTHPWVKKHHSFTLNTKLQLQLTIWTALVQDIHLTTKNCVSMVKDYKTTSKSINQIRPVLMPWWNTGGGGVKKRCFFPPKKKLWCGAQRADRVLNAITKRLLTGCEIILPTGPIR